MTSASIMEMQQSSYVSSANAVKSNAANAANAQMQFSDAMQFASAGQQEDGADVVRESDAKVHAEKSASQHTGRKEIRETDATSEKQEISDEKISEEMKTEEEAAVKEIAEQLGVSEEEVREAMEVLGFGVMDLLSQGNMVALTAQLTGMQTVDVLMDEQLFSQITDLTQTIQNQMQTLADELGVSLEQLQNMIDEQMAADVAAQTQEPVAEETLQSQEPEQQQAFVQAGEVVADDEMVTADKQIFHKSADADGLYETETTIKVQSAADAEKSTDTGSEEKDASSMMNGQQTNAAPTGDANYVNQTKAGDILEETFDLQRTREMIDQIADYVRVHHSEKISAMEIQLHPVELGTVNLQVVAKDGAVSAQLTVQDEAIRAALEGQMMQLRESLQEQGLKIDAVEVTVASHEFEENLDQQGRDAEEEAAREKKSGRRILDLNEIGQEELEEMEMSDAERLQVEMMRMGGNRMNFRV